MSIYCIDDERNSEYKSNDIWVLEMLFDSMSFKADKKIAYLNKWQIEYIKNIILEAIEHLDDFSKKIIDLCYGVYDTTSKQEKDCIDLWVKQNYREYNLDLQALCKEEEIDINDIELGNFLRKRAMHRIFRMRYGEKILFGLRTCNKTASTVFEFRKVIQKEILNLVSYDCDYSYLDRILKKHNWILEVMSITKEDRKIDIEKMGFSDKTYELLKENEIENLYDLKTFTYKWITLPEECIQEIEEKRKMYRVKKRGFSFKFIQEGEKTCYKIEGKSKKEIAEYIYQILFPESIPNILENLSISHELENLLLLMGYVFIDEIENDYELILNELKSMYSYAIQEFRLIFDRKKIYIKSVDGAVPIKEELIDSLGKPRIAFDDMFYMGYLGVEP